MLVWQGVERENVGVLEEDQLLPAITSKRQEVLKLQHEQALKYALRGVDQWVAANAGDSRNARVNIYMQLATELLQMKLTIKKEELHDQFAATPK